MNTSERTFAHTVFPDSVANRSWPTRIRHGSEPDTRSPPAPIDAVGTAGTVVVALALAAGTARASVAVTAANAARGFRRDMVVEPPTRRTAGAAACRSLTAR